LALQKVRRLAGRDPPVLTDFDSQPQASSLKPKPQPQALRPAPASLSFYPAEKKVSKENGGHGMEHVVCVGFCDVNLTDSQERSGCSSVARPRGPLAPALTKFAVGEYLHRCCFFHWFKGHGITERVEAMAHALKTTALQRSAGAKGNGPVNRVDG
jgi:hypothetical protein